MTDWQQRFERLRDSIRVFQWREAVDMVRWAHYKDDPGYREHVLKTAALALGNAMLRDGLLEVREWDSDGNDEYPGPKGTHIFHIRAEVLAPETKPGAFAAQLDEAKRAGYAEAVADIRKAARAFARLSNYGPMQALALDGVADQLEKRLGELLAA